MSDQQAFGYDSETLLLAFQTVAWLMAILTLAGLWHVRGRFGLVFWVASFLAIALSQALRPLVFAHWGIYLSFSLGHIGGLIASAFLYFGVRAFLDLPLQVMKVGAVVALGATGSLLINIFEHPNIYSSMLTLSLGAVLRLWACTVAYQAWREQRSRAWLLMAAFLFVSAGLQLLRAFSVYWASELPEAEKDVIHGQMLLIATAMLVAQGMCVLILVSDAFFREIRWHAERDALTGLLNRRGLHDRFAKWQGSLAAVPRHVYLLDVDHFKQINDQLGHAAGDEVLKELGRRLQRAIESLNILPMPLLARMGGEEFIVVCHGLTQDAAERLANRLVDIVRSEPFVTGQGERAVTISIGLSQAASADSLERQLQRSDAALYAAKGAGRNRWIDAVRI